MIIQADTPQDVLDEIVEWFNAEEARLSELSQNKTMTRSFRQQMWDHARLCSGFALEFRVATIQPKDKVNDDR